MALEAYQQIFVKPAGELRHCRWAILDSRTADLGRRSAFPGYRTGARSIFIVCAQQRTCAPFACASSGRSQPAGVRTAFPKALKHPVGSRRLPGSSVLRTPA